jgi:hypothetical protein
VAKRKDLNGATPTPLVGVGTKVPTDDGAAIRWPNLMQCLMPQWSDDKLTRQGGTLAIKPLGAWWSITLRCPAEGVETSVALLTLVDFPDALEATLRDGTAIWRPTYEAQKKAGQRRG